MTHPWMELRTRIVGATERFADLLRAAPTPTEPIPGLEWDVGELGAHVVSVPTRYRRMMATPEPFPVSLSAMNEAEIAAVSTREPEELADLLSEEVAALLDDLGDHGDRVVPFFGMEHTVAGLAGVLLGELLLHGMDLAGLQGERVTMTHADALAFARGIVPAVVHSVDAQQVARTRGTFHLHLRPDDDWTFVVGDGTVAVTPGRPRRADVRISADPVAFVLTGYGRANPAVAAATGRIVAYGRKPWLAGRFSKLFAET